MDADALIESPILARELGERGRDRALEEFSADRILLLYEALYRRVVAGKMHRAGIETAT